MLKTNIIDKLTGLSAKVTGEGLLNVVVHPHPPAEPLTALPFRQYITDNGLSTGSKSMLVDGSTVEKEFWISASEDHDIYINSISFVIADAGATLNNFGSITALTNGCELVWRTVDLGSEILHESLKSNFDFVRLCNGYPAFGTAADSFRAKNVIGTSEGFLPSLDFCLGVSGYVLVLLIS
jgi:hypothetical protein